MFLWWQYFLLGIYIYGYQGTTQHWEKQYFEITPLYYNVFVIILLCEDIDKLPFFLSEVWRKGEALYPCKMQLGR